MSINWVMLSASPSSPHPFAPLSNEKVLHSSPPRVALSISTTSKSEPSAPTNCSSGVLYLTNQRIVYLPEKATDAFKSFAAPVLNLHDTHVTAPFFGPNVMSALLQPVNGGGIQTPSSGVVELKLTFKDGGAFDFHSKFERVKERLQQAVEVSRMSGSRTPAARNAMEGLDVTTVDLEELPAYQEESDGPLISPVVASQSSARANSRVAAVAPTGPPPGYEEAQMQSVEDGIRRRSNAAAPS